jgi:hypothetical protein
MPVPWALVVLPVRATAVAPVPMVTVLMAAVVVRQVRASRLSLRAWPVVTVVLAVPVAMRRVRVLAVTAELVVSAAMATTVRQHWSLVLLVVMVVPVVLAVIRSPDRPATVATPVPVVSAAMVPTVRLPLCRARRAATAVMRAWRVLREPA